MNIEPPRDPRLDPLLEQLGELPALDVSDVVAERVRQRAHAVLARTRRPLRRQLQRYYRRAEPVIVFAAAAAYLIRVFRDVLAVYG